MIADQEPACRQHQGTKQFRTRSLGRLLHDHPVELFTSLDHALDIGRVDRRNHHIGAVEQKMDHRTKARSGFRRESQLRGRLPTYFNAERLYPGGNGPRNEGHGVAHRQPGQQVECQRFGLGMG